jgi:iron complex outermembrane recepter protein
MGPTSKKAALFSCAALMALSLGSAAWAAPRNFDVPAQDAVKAIPEFGRQAGVQVVAPADRLKGIRTLAVRGSMEISEALALLLRGTGLEVAANDGRVIVLRLQDEAPASPPAQRGASNADGEEESPGQEPVEKVTVTGSRIRGAKSASPVVTIEQDEMRRAGHNDLGEVIRAMPQNFSGGQSPGVAPGASGAGLANQNLTGGSSLNLRGLGPDATLTLLNGARLPFDGLYQTTDVASIPLAAIDRIEVLLDGASAIYGSDAVGGVANIILKRDYDGAEFSARVGKATDGGYTQTQYSGVAGTTWESGGFLVAADASHSAPIRASQRDYLAYMPVQQTTLYPENTQAGALFSGHQQVGSALELSIDAFYSERQHNLLYSAFSVVSRKSDSTIWGLSPAATFTLPDDWQVKVHGFLGRNEADIDQPQYGLTTGALLRLSRECYCNKSEAAGVEAEGPLFDLPAGEARLSFGGGYRRYEIEYTNLLTGTPLFGIAGEDRAKYFYGEVNIPLISEDQSVPLIERFSLDGAFRYEDYKSFGDTTTPKIGALWTVTSGFDVRASWGRSFKTPTLLQQNQSTDLYLYPGASFTDAPAGSTVMFVEGGNAGLQPEEAEILTAGFVAQPEFLPGAHLEVGWFDIDYTNRVVFPHGSRLLQALVNPAVVDFVMLNPTQAQQAAAVLAADQFFNFGNPDFTPAPFPAANVYAYIDTRYTNASRDRVQGVDVAARYTVDAFDGSLSLSGSGSWILDATRTLTPVAPEQLTSGVAFFPPEFRGRLGASWSDGKLTISSAANYLGDVINNQITPNVEGSSMTTVDLVIDYQTDSPVFGGIGLNVSVSNIFDEHPPFMQPLRPFAVNYDSTNYSAIGRVVSATITKRF